MARAREGDLEDGDAGQGAEARGGPLLDHDAQSYDEIAPAFLDNTLVDTLTRDEVLDNIRLTWLTNTGVSSAENKLGFFDIKGVKVPLR